MVRRELVLPSLLPRLSSVRFYPQDVWAGLWPQRTVYIDLLSGGTQLHVHECICVWYTSINACLCECMKPHLYTVVQTVMCVCVFVCLTVWKGTLSPSLLRNETKVPLCSVNFRSYGALYVDRTSSFPPPSSLFLNHFVGVIDNEEAKKKCSIKIHIRKIYHPKFNYIILSLWLRLQ